MIKLKYCGNLKVPHKIQYGYVYRSGIFVLWQKCGLLYSHFCVDSDEFCVVANRSSAFFGVCSFGCTHFFILWGEILKEKIYYLNESSKTLHIKGFCKSAVTTKTKTYYTEQEAIEDNGKFIHMCIDCERQKEEVLLKAVTLNNDL